MDSCIAWLSERLAAGGPLTAQIRPKRYDVLAAIELAPAQRWPLLWESGGLVAWGGFLTLVRLGLRFANAMFVDGSCGADRGLCLCDDRCLLACT